MAERHPTQKNSNHELCCGRLGAPADIVHPRKGDSRLSEEGSLLCQRRRHGPSSGLSVVSSHKEGVRLIP